MTDLDPSHNNSIMDCLQSNPRTWHELQKELIKATLIRLEGNRTHTAEALQISIRTLRNKLQEYGIVTPPTKRYAPVFKEDALTTFTDIQMKNGLFDKKKEALSQMGQDGKKPIELLVIQIIQVDE